MNFEDRILKRSRVTPSTTGTIHSSFNVDVRVNKTIGNDSENDTYFLILLLATAIISDGQNDNCTRTIVYGVIYFYFRIFYALTYIAALQPWRTVVFYGGLACNFDLVITMSRRAN